MIRGILLKNIFISLTQKIFLQWELQQNVEKSNHFVCLIRVF